MRISDWSSDVCSSDLVSLSQKMPLTVFDDNQLTSPVVKAAVILVRHVVDALRSHQFVGLFQSVAQGAAKFLGAGLGLFLGDGDRFLQKQARVVDIRAECGGDRQSAV